MILNAVLWLGSTLFLLSLAGVLTWDWIRASRGESTISSWVRDNVWNRWKGQPWFWLFLGLVAGFALGLVVGFVGGHLFWPVT